MKRAVPVWVVLVVALAAGSVGWVAKDGQTGPGRGGLKAPEVDWSGVGDMHIHAHAAGRDGDTPIRPGTYRPVTIAGDRGAATRPHPAGGAPVVTVETNDGARTVVHVVRVGP